MNTVGSPKPEVQSPKSRVRTGLAAACLSLLLACSALADTWTNRAGHVVTARLVAIEGDQLVLQHTNGRIRRVPLTTLRPADQLRAREQAGTEALPSALKVPLEQAQSDIRRAAQFLQGGKISREEYDVRCRQIKQRFEQLGQQALKERGEQSNTNLLEQIKKRLGRLEFDSLMVLQSQELNQR